MLLIGFKNNWSKDLDDAAQYFNILEAAFDHAYSVGILRVKTRLDFSDHIKSVETEDGDAGTLSFVRKRLVINASFKNCIGVSSH